MTAGLRQLLLSRQCRDSRVSRSVSGGEGQQVLTYNETVCRRGQWTGGQGAPVGGRQFRGLAHALRERVFLFFLVSVYHIGLVWTIVRSLLDCVVFGRCVCAVQLFV